MNPTTRRTQQTAANSGASTTWWQSVHRTEQELSRVLFRRQQQYQQQGPRYGVLAASALSVAVLGYVGTTAYWQTKEQEEQEENARINTAQPHQFWPDATLLIAPPQVARMQSAMWAPTPNSTTTTADEAALARGRSTLWNMTSPDFAELETKYRVNWRRPLGEGAFGAVYLATNRSTGERVAVKKISQRFTNQAAFQNEMGALLEIQKAGGHPHINGMQDHFVQPPSQQQQQQNNHKSDYGYFYLVLDLISGGEMFDHLCHAGPYSEADAARLIREVASAMNFLHGIGIVHGDLKPENLMLSSKEAAKAVIKVVDFGCARSHVMEQAQAQAAQTAKQAQQSSTRSTLASWGFGGSWSRTPSDDKAIEDADDDVDDEEEEPFDYQTQGTANTPAYSPPEVLLLKRSDDIKKRNTPIEPSFDMWAVGVILYIMLTGVHPFDLYGNATDQEIEDAVLSGKKPPLGKSALTAHLSPDATNLIELLLEWNPQRRLTAHQLLDHPWVKGETARTQVIADSDKRLRAYRAYKTKLEAKAFADMISASADNAADAYYAAKQQATNTTGGGGGNGDVDVNKKMSLIEISFSRFDPDNKGFITAKELRKLVGNDDPNAASEIPNDERLSMSCFSDILAGNMKNKHFPKGHMIYKEGEIGNAMYFINSGSVEVFTKDGYRSTRHAGEFFGEGALLNPKKTRSASIRALTPIHVMEISRDYFEKYMSSDSDVKVKLREKDKARKRQRAKTLLQLHQNTKEKLYKKGDKLFQKGERTTDLFILSEGDVWLQAKGQDVISVDMGEICGEHSAVFGRPRNVDAVCKSDECKALVLHARDFQKLLSTQPHFKESIREICLRREFQKALCVDTGKPFPKDEKDLKAAFDFVASHSGNTEFIEFDGLKSLLHNFDPTYTEEDMLDILESLDLDETGRISWSEFKRIFGMDGGAAATKEKPRTSRDWRRKKWKR
uniref:cGMP-dependent protein kinase n=1 Tax=Entomoneis paludosa TaxID=265537 RepID=A0A7S2YCT2_9STRA|mmetsp:Transcript_27720/g.58037  ORF Transcript_27720/g.58037 Transcript_27720/m.58037 type:complete len:956 (+) Transcript_27720:487-3354(+)